MKKRILFGLILTALLIALSGTALAVGYVQATGGDVYLRTSPNLDGKKLDSMKEGETASYLNGSAVDDRGVLWYYVNFEGDAGWVSSRYSKLYGASIILPDFSSTSSAYVKAVGGDVNLRTSPNLNGGKLTSMKEGQTAAYLNGSSVDDRGVVWYKVSFNGKTGWVSSRYSELYNNFNTVQAVGGNCNIRTAPNLNGNEIGVMKEGQKGTYLNSSSVDERGVTWYRVSFNGKTGWVSSRYTDVY